MRQHYSVRFLLALVAASGSCIASQDCVAQTTVAVPEPPMFKTVDPVGVDLMSQAVTGSVNAVSIGEGPGKLAHVFHITSGQITPYLLADSYVGTLTGYGPFALANGTLVTAPGGTTPQTNCPFQVSIGDSSDCFVLNNGVYTPMRSDGATLVSLGGGAYQYQDKNGTIYALSPIPSSVTFTAIPSTSFTAAVATSIRQPNGVLTTINWTNLGLGYNSSYVINSVINNYGYMLKYDYASVSGSFVGANANTTYFILSSVRAINNAIDYCDPSAILCSTTHAWKSANYSWTVSCPRSSGSPANTQCSQLSITDQAGLVTRYTMDTSYRVTGIKPPTATTDQYTFIHCMDSWGSGDVCTSGGVIGYPTFSVVPQGAGILLPTTDGGDVVYAIKEGRQWQYLFTNSGPESGGVVGFTNQSVDPDGRIQINIGWHTNSGGAVPGTSTTPFYDYVYLVNNGKTQGNYAQMFAFDGQLDNNIYSFTGGGFSENYAYDARLNLIKATKITPTGSGISNIVQSAAYPAFCTNLITCNKPTSSTDGNGNVTNYTYDPVHGGALTVTQPALNGVQPQARYTYGQMSAYYLNASGALVASANPVWVLLQESTCLTGAASGAGCAVAGDELRKTYLYGAAGSMNNLLLHGIVLDSAPGGKALTTCYSYDANGNRISETKPKGVSGATCP
jgi:hypothetical protein